MRFWPTIPFSSTYRTKLKISSLPGIKLGTGVCEAVVSLPTATDWTRKCFHDDNVIIIEMKSWFSSKSADFYEDGSKDLFLRYETSVVIGDQCLEKEESVD